MRELDLQHFDPENCTIFVTPYDVRQDLHTFVTYVREREVKRAYRTNWLSKTDSKRLLKLMGHPEELEFLAGEDRSAWLDFVDSLALKLGFVHYDTAGVYVGYTSQEPSFPDNYIQFQAETYADFLALSPLEQEKRLLDTLITWKPGGYLGSSANEFYQTSTLGRLHGFSTRGSALGVMPGLNFPQARRFLLDLLARCQSDVWYSTASLIAYLKAHRRYFLIPQKPKSDRWGRAVSRYGNFYETKKPYETGKPVPDDAPDGFERVEGRYVERFLEGIPLTLGYVDVAYARKYRGLLPERGHLQAFRVGRRFLHLMREEIAAPRVTVQPDFEIHVEAEFYPVGVIHQLQPFTTTVTVDRVVVLKLNRQKVAASLAQDDTVDLIGLLQRLSGRPLPQNVRVELEEWAGQAEAFTLYSGFALWEGRGHAPRTENLTVETIAPHLRIVHSADRLFHQLEQAELVPYRARHGAKAFTALPAGVKTLFPRKTQKQPRKRQAKPRLVLQRETHITLHLPDEDVFARLTTALANHRCLFTSDPPRRTITYAQCEEEKVKAALQALRQHYTLRIVDRKTA